MGDWEDVDGPFSADIKPVDRIVYTDNESSPELRWAERGERVRPADVGPPPKRASTGRRAEEWIPGGTPKARTRRRRNHGLVAAARMAVVTLLPLGFLAGVSVLLLRAYGFL